MKANLAEIDISFKKESKLTYASIAKKKISHYLEKTDDIPDKNNASNSSSQKNCKNVVFIRKLDEGLFENPLQFKVLLSQHFEKLKIVHLYKKTFNDVIVLFLHSQTDVDFIIDNWSKSIFKDAEIISAAQQNSLKPKSFEVILKGVPFDFTDSFILNSVQSTYPSAVAVNRFTKQGKILSTVKAGFSDESDFNSCLSSGIFISDVFLQAHKLIHVKKPLQCFKCFKFGHISKNCSDSQICGNCGQGDHMFNECNFSKKCSNCNGPHCAKDISLSLIHI